LIRIKRTAVNQAFKPGKHQGETLCVRPLYKPQAAVNANTKPEMRVPMEVIGVRFQLILDSFLWSLIGT
jgi:hypothetical protein